MINLCGPAENLTLMLLVWKKNAGMQGLKSFKESVTCLSRNRGRRLLSELLKWYFPHIQSAFPLCPTILAFFLFFLKNIHQIREKHITGKKTKTLSVERLDVFCAFPLELCVAQTEPGCSECCACITVFHKLNGSESVTVRRRLMSVVWRWLNTWARL